jgi:hypothetical protein
MLKFEVPPFYVTLKNGNGSDTPNQRQPLLVAKDFCVEDEEESFN